MSEVTNRRSFSVARRGRTALVGPGRPWSALIGSAAWVVRTIIGRRCVVGDHVVHHHIMFQILGWAAMALTGLELSMGVRSFAAGRLRRAV